MPLFCLSLRLTAWTSSLESSLSWQPPSFQASLSVSSHKKHNSIFLGEVWAWSAPQTCCQHGFIETSETGRNKEYGVPSENRLFCLTVIIVVWILVLPPAFIFFSHAAAEVKLLSHYIQLLHSAWGMRPWTQAQLSSLQNATGDTVPWTCFDHFCLSFALWASFLSYLTWIVYFQWRVVLTSPLSCQSCQSLLKRLLFSWLKLNC